MAWANTSDAQRGIYHDIRVCVMCHTSVGKLAVGTNITLTTYYIYTSLVISQKVTRELRQKQSKLLLCRTRKIITQPSELSITHSIDQTHSWRARFFLLLYGAKYIFKYIYRSQYVIYRQQQQQQQEQVVVVLVDLQIAVEQQDLPNIDIRVSTDLKQRTHVCMYVLSMQITRVPHPATQTDRSCFDF